MGGIGRCEGGVEVDERVVEVRLDSTSKVDVRRGEMID